MSVEKERARARARTCSPVSRSESRAVIDGLVQWLDTQPACGVLTFLSMRGEIGAESIVGRTHHRPFTTRTPAQGPLTVHPFHGARERHRYGFEQPLEGSKEADLSNIGIVLVPGLAFDRTGGRLGRGKGYYDRLLARLPGRLRVALTLERLIVPRVPTEAHDISMTHLATENGVKPVS